MNTKILQRSITQSKVCRMIFASSQLWLTSGPSNFPFNSRRNVSVGTIFASSRSICGGDEYGKIRWYRGGKSSKNILNIWLQQWLIQLCEKTHSRWYSFISILMRKTFSHYPHTMPGQTAETGRGETRMEVPQRIENKMAKTQPIKNDDINIHFRSTWLKQSQ